MVEGRRRILGEEHPDTLASMDLLGIALHNAFEERRSRRLLKRVLSARTRTLGPDHPDTLRSRHLLAGRSRKDSAATREYEEVLADRRRVLGAEHPDTLITQDSLALHLRFAGDLGRSRALLEETLAIRRRTLGDDHPDTYEDFESMVEVFRDQGSRDEIVPLVRDAADRVRRCPPSLDRLRAMARLGRMLSDEQEWRTALGVLEETLAGLEAFPARDDDDLGVRLRCEAAKALIILGERTAAGGHLRSAMQEAGRRSPDDRGAETLLQAVWSTERWADDHEPLREMFGDLVALADGLYGPENPVGRRLNEALG